MKKILAIILVVSLLLPAGLVSYADDNAVYQEFNDIKGHWAEKTIVRHHGMGMLRGYPDGSFKPDQQMKRSELITLVNHYFGLKEEGNKNFEDIAGKEWYAEETAKAKYYGYIEGLQARPNDLATREDVIDMLNLIIDVEEQKAQNGKKSFKDLEGMEEEEREKIETFSQMGYISGYEDGTFKPEQIINRAEIMTMIENVLGYIVDSQDDVDHMPENVTKVTIISPNIRIENKVIQGDLYIAPGANGKIVIKDSEITGQIVVSGGNKEQPVDLENVKTEKIVVTKGKETLKVVISGESSIGELKTKSNANIDMSEAAKIKKLTIESETKVKTRNGSQIETLEAKEKAEITGEGTIHKAEIKSEGVSIEKRPEYVKVDEKVDKAQIGNSRMDSANDDYGKRKSSGSSGRSNRDNSPPNWEEGYPLAKMKTGEGRIKILAKLDEASTVYYCIYEVSADVHPAADDLIRSGDSFNAEGSTVVEEIYGQQIDPAKNYLIYFIAVDEYGNQQADVKVITVSQIDTIPPVFTKKEGGIVDLEGTIQFTVETNEPSTIYYILSDVDASLPTVKQVKAGMDYNGVTVLANGSGSQLINQKILGIPYGKSYKIYLAAEDASGNITEEASVITVENSVFVKIKNGFIPVADKEELKQIEVESDKVFGKGTPWEGTYTGGMDKKYMLVADIDLSGDNFVPIGYDEAGDTSTLFTGKLDGQGFAIKNLNIERNKNLQGLFSRLGSGAWLSDITIQDVNMKTSSRSGVLAGASEGAEIYNTNILNVSYDLSDGDPANPAANTKKAIGGFVGDSTNTLFREVELSNFVMELTDPAACESLIIGVGGITGVMDGGGIYDSQVKGIKLAAIHDITNMTMYFMKNSGGFVGQLNNSSTQQLIIDNSKVENLDMTVGGFGNKENCGGFIGEIDTSDSETATCGDIQVTGCSVAGTLKGKGYLVGLGTSLAGGFAGYIDGSGTPKGTVDISHCSSSVAVSELLVPPSYIDVMISIGGIGGFGGRLKNVNIVDCHATGNIGRLGKMLDGGEAVDEFLCAAGGFAGWIIDSSVEDCSASGNVIGYFFSGGFAGIIENSHVNRCFAAGNITDLIGGFDKGGFAGAFTGDNTVTDSYCNGDVNMVNLNMIYVGGFAGDIGGNTTVYNVYATGRLTGNITELSGGIAGKIVKEVSVLKSFWNQSANPGISGIGTNSGIADIQGKTEEELKKIDTFGGWDISHVSEGRDTIWLIEEGKYPYLRENRMVEINN